MCVGFDSRYPGDESSFHWENVIYTLEIIPIILESYYYFLRSSRLKYQYITEFEFEDEEIQ